MEKREIVFSTNLDLPGELEKIKLEEEEEERLKKMEEQNAYWEKLWFNDPANWFSEWLDVEDGYVTCDYLED